MLCDKCGGNKGLCNCEIHVGQKVRLVNTTNAFDRFTDELFERIQSGITKNEFKVTWIENDRMQIHGFCYQTNVFGSLIVHKNNFEVI